MDCFVTANPLLDEDAEPTERNKLAVLRLYEQLNEGSHVTYEEFVDEDIRMHGPASGQETRKRVNLEKIAKSFMRAYPDMKIFIQDLIATGDKVVVRWSLRATHFGEYRGVPPTYREVAFSGTHIYRFGPMGKMIESWAMHDRLGEFGQLGLVSTRLTNGKRLYE